MLVTDSVDPRRAEHDELRADGPAATRIRVRWRDRATPWFTYLMLPPRPDGGRRRARAGGACGDSSVDESPRYAVVLERSPSA